MGENKQRGLIETRFILHLLHVQRSRCFHCGEEMLRAALAAGADRLRGWTREHVFPRRGSGRELVNNIVLAHPTCNSWKGNREPTVVEIEKARAIYRAMGLVAFERFDPLIHQFARRQQRRRERQRDLVGHDVRPGAFATLADVWRR